MLLLNLPAPLKLPPGDGEYPPMVKLLALSSSMQERLRTVKGDRYAKKKQGATRDEPEEYKDDDDAAPPEEYRYEKDSADD